jgi:hypothetical protein
MGALQVSTCFGGINATSDPCLCIPVSQGQTYTVAFGGRTGFNGLPVFEGSPRAVIDPVPNDLGGERCK